MKMKITKNGNYKLVFNSNNDANSICGLINCYDIDEEGCKACPFDSLESSRNYVIKRRKDD